MLLHFSIVIFTTSSSIQVLYTTINEREGLIVTYNRLPGQYQPLVEGQQALRGLLRALCNDSIWIQVSPWTWTLQREVVDKSQSHKVHQHLVTIQYCQNNIQTADKSRGQT